ncbi:hypothetical protein FDP41_011311 [Naegleria fowleri]|uniref:Longin domain-containing protein n=1 Tax=Naegleria fowleri TaxID=5763 RepID=A0A6A5C5M0_NAEFO|nr:uncharacterized protein FDP41_011311 [Naegleria fowleri]KAF0982381.1 hypothetical protein FDP41_011311 [Naegleria fowleri]
MKLLAINVLYRPNDIGSSSGSSSTTKSIILSGYDDLSSFGFFQRSTVREYIVFISRVLSDKNPPGTRQQVIKDEYTCYVQTRIDSQLSAVIVCDAEYPSRVAFSLLYKVLTEFEKKYPKSVYLNSPSILQSDYQLQLETINDYLVKYQDPNQADELLKIKTDLEETKTIMNQVLEKMFEREDDLKNLVGMSEDLSMSSRAFYTAAQGENGGCCLLM